MTSGTPIINDVTYADGRKIIGRLGGSVFYGLYALAMCSDDPVYADMVGKDFEDFYKTWMDDNNLTRDGIVYGEEETVYLEVFYHPNGLWEHRLVPKADGTFHNDKIGSLSVEQVAKFADKCAGHYLNTNVTCPFWPQFLQLRDETGFKLMWEVGTQDFIPQLRKDVLDLISKCDYHSMNLEEARILFDMEDEMDIVKAIADLKIPCFFRVGEKGAYMIRSDKATFVPSVGVTESVDATGCGNSSTAVATVGLCEEWDDAYTVALANAVAAINARFVGLCPKVTDDLRQEAKEIAQKLMSKAQVISL